jgi:hypothetical protein
LSNSLTLAALFPFADINVDLHRPEHNHGFIIYDLGQTVQGVGDFANRFYFGFAIFKKIDVRHVLDDKKTTHYKARITGANQITITEPAWDYNHLFLRDNLAEKLDEFVVDSIDDAHDKYDKNTHGNKEERRWRHSRLNFPGVTQLDSVTIFDKATDDQWLKLDIVPIKYTDRRINPHPVVDTYAMWRVVRLDKDSRKKGKAEIDKEDVSDAAKLIEALGFGEEDEAMG